MKNIIYIMIAVLLFGIIAMGFTNKTNTKTSILVETVDNNISAATLHQSVEIISARLKDYSSGKFEINAIPEKNQIQVVLYNKWNLTEVEKLLTQKGSLGFYETYDKKSLTELLNGETKFFSFFNSSGDKDSGTWIGKTPVTGVEKVNEYIKSSGLDKKCSLSWCLNQEESNMILYALKSEKGALLNNNDVESIKFGYDKKHKFNEVKINFKTEAIKNWADATKQNLGKAIAVVLDNNIYYAPVVRCVIEGGKCTITGNLTESQIKFFAAIGNNGELPADFKIIK